MFPGKTAGLSLVLIASLVAESGAQGGSQSDLLLGPINFAGYNNYVYRDNVTSVQAVVSSNPAQSSSNKTARFILAFPKGNSGAAVYFSPNNGTLALSLDRSSLQSVSTASNQTGVSGRMNVSSDLTFGQTLIGSVRTIRDYTEGGGLLHEIFNHTLGPYNSSSLSLVRNWINGSVVQYFNFYSVSNLNFSVTRNSNATLPPKVVLTRPNQALNGTLGFTCTFNFTNVTEPLIGLGGNQLFLASAPAEQNRPQGYTSRLDSTLQAINGPGRSIANQTAFLSNTNVFFAGGWRFLTYFGRDTLLSLRLLASQLTREASEGVMKAVLERVRVSVVPGEIAHEDTVGDYASFVNIQNNQSNLGATPSQSYVMADSDYLLLPVLADYLVSSSQGRGRAGPFLNQTSALNPGTLRQLLLLNVDHVLNMTAPFVRNQTYSNLIEIRDALVGDWRDSGTGLGYGRYAFDINTAFVPSCLRAIASLADNGIIPANYSAPATQAAQIFENNAYKLFEVQISSQTASSRLNNYVQAANLTNTTLQGPGVLRNASSNGSAYGNTTYAIGTGNGNSTYYALSLLKDGTPVEILHSDLGFTLEYNNNVPASIIRATIEALQPYPRGLLTNVGMVVANAAYDRNTTDIQTFSNNKYHGAVVWSWQQGIMAKGIAKQLALAGVGNSTSISLTVTANATKPAWASDAQLVSELQKAQTRLWDSIQGSASVLYTEVWSPVYNNQSNTFSIGDLGQLSVEGTEGDAIQLWSYGFLGLIDPRTNKPVAAGF